MAQPSAPHQQSPANKEATHMLGLIIISGFVFGFGAMLVVFAVMEECK